MMGQQLIVFLFLIGALPLVLSVTRKFYLIQQLKTWPNAHLYCLNNYADLATIESDLDKLQFQHEVTDKQFTSIAWTGLYEDITSWRWSLGNVTLGSFRYWGSGQPDNQPGEECVAADIYGLWWDAECWNAFNFMCFDATQTGVNRYIYYSVKKTWKDAQTFCRQQHTDLASSLSSTDNSDMVAATPQSSTLLWVGLFRDAWKWSDHTPLSTINWAPGVPEPFVTANCGSINNLYQCVNFPCTDLKPFFCYSVITGQQQMIRIKLVSNQDVEDTTVKATILGKILQILTNHGMGEGITLKWMENQNANVFEKITQ